MNSIEYFIKNQLVLTIFTYKMDAKTDFLSMTSSVDDFFSPVDTSTNSITYKKPYGFEELSLSNDTFSVKHDIAGHGTLSVSENMFTNNWTGSLSSTNYLVHATGTSKNPLTVGLGVRDNLCSGYLESRSGKQTFTGVCRPFRMNGLAFGTQSDLANLSKSVISVGRTPPFMESSTDPVQNALNKVGFKVSGNYAGDACVNLDAKVLTMCSPRVTVGAFVSGTIDVKNMKGELKPFSLGTDLRPTGQDLLKLRTDGETVQAQYTRNLTSGVKGTVGTTFTSLNTMPKLGFGFELS